MGLSGVEREIVANVARYHRKSAPDPSHGNFERLGKDDRARVRVLAGLLRIADALDREHLGKVESLHASVDLGRQKLCLTLRRTRRSGPRGVERAREGPSPPRGARARGRADQQRPPAGAPGDALNGWPLTLALLGCASSHVPDPTPVARSFARACERGDAHAVRALLSDDQKLAISEATVRAQLAEPGAKVRCAALAHRPTTTSGLATMRFATGESATVRIEHGEARVAAAGTLPGGGGTPEAALASFRGSLLRWLAAGSLGPLTQSTRSRTEERLRTLAERLAQPDALLVEVWGDRAKVDLVPGHFVSLRREDGLWRVEDFE